MWNLDNKEDNHRVSMTVACKWQIFGFRMVYVVVYFPIDFILMLVVLRNCKDNIFNYSLRDKIHHAIVVDDQDPNRNGTSGGKISQTPIRD